MPFTASHPAAVIPVFRTGLVPSALVVGSMIPDLPYYLPVPVSSALTHSFIGIVGVDLALGLIVFALWVTVIAPVLVAFSPAPVRDRLAPGLPVSAAHHARTPMAIVVVLASLTVGAFTHIAWDAFTHPDRWGTRHIEWLSTTHGPLHGYSWLQYASGLVGAAVIVAAGARWWATTPVTPDAQRIPPRSRRAALRAIAIVAACACAGAVAGLVNGLGGEDFRRTGFLALTWGLGAGAVAILAIALVYLPGLRREARGPSDAHW